MTKQIVADVLSPFSMTEKQLLLTIRNRAVGYGTTLEDCVFEIEREVAEFKNTIIPAKSSRRNNVAINKQVAAHACPECGASLRISAIRSCERKIVGERWQSVLICEGEQCKYTELSEKTVAMWRAK